jgi:hypothetical protein
MLEMKLKVRTSVLAGILLMTSGVAVYAHHAEVAYDTTRVITLKGTITKLVWTNPHAMIHFQVKNEQNQLEVWIIELSSLGSLVRSGWTKNTFKPGDQIEVESHPHKEGLHRINFEKLTINGKVIRDKGPG